MKRLLTMLLCVMVLAGCAGAGSEREQPPRPTKGSQPALLDAVITARDKAEASSGRLVEKVVWDFGPVGAVSQIMQADFNGPAASYRVETWFEATSEPAERFITQGDMGIDQLRAKMLQVDGAAYLTMVGWPPERRGRWLEYTEQALAEHAGAEDTGPLLTGATPSKLLETIDLADEKVTSSPKTPDRDKTYYLTVPAAWAVGALGNSAVRGLDELDIDPTELTGTVPLQVEVDDRNRILRADLDVTAVMKQLFERSGEQGMPADFTIVVQLNITDYGKPVTVKAPPKSKLIDPSEMN